MIRASDTILVKPLGVFSALRRAPVDAACLLPSLDKSERDVMLNITQSRKYFTPQWSPRTRRGADL